MKTVSKRVGEIRRGEIIRYPVEQTLYHRVRGLGLSGDNVTIIVDGGRTITADIKDHFYVLEDEPAPIILDGVTLE